MRLWCQDMAVVLLPLLAAYRVPASLDVAHDSDKRNKRI